jgi:hypothetical protein
MTTGMLTADALRELVRRGDIDTVLVVFPDLYWPLDGQTVPRSFFH